MQYYDRDTVARALPYDRLIDAIEEAFRRDATVPQRAHHRVEVPGAADATLLMMPAWRAGEALGVKIATVYPDNGNRALPAVYASYLLLDASTGEPRAIFDGSELTLRRTAASSALASRYLSRADASKFLMVGTGKLAPHLIAAHSVVRSIDEVMIWGRRRQAAQNLAVSLGSHPCAVTVVDDLEEAVAGSDIVSCATLATEPLIRGKWLHAGQHLDLVGAFRPDMREADADAIVRADVYVDTLAGATKEAGDIVQAIESGELEEESIVGDLFALTRGTCRRRESPTAITLFKSVGTALEDLAAAELAAAGR